MAAAASAVANFDSLSSAPSTSALQIFYASTNHTLSYARAQACTLSALDLRGTALAWDQPSYNALLPHASLADALGAWDAPLVLAEYNISLPRAPATQHPKTCECRLGEALHARTPEARSADRCRS